MWIELAKIALAIVGGAVMKKVSKPDPESTGKRKWHKVLAPAAALAVGIGVNLATGGQVQIEEVLKDGGEVGLIASGVYSWAKNGLQFFKGENDD